MEKTSIFARHRRVAVCLLALVCFARIAVAGSSDDLEQISWKPGVTFSRTSVDDDVRNVLRAVLGANGISVIFRPGVEGKVSLNFRNMPLQAAFEQLLQENGLRASYNPGRLTVTVMPGTGPGGPTRKFITLRNVEWSSLRQMLTSFGIGTEGITFDPATSILSVTGPDARIAQTEDLVKTLERHYGERHEQELGDSQRAASAQRSDLERRVYQDAMNVQTKVFRLRFADVGPTTRNFHGRSVTIPGVLETLQAMLGTGQAPPFTTQAPAAMGFRPATRSRPVRRCGRCCRERCPAPTRAKGRGRPSSPAWRG